MFRLPEEVKKDSENYKCTLEKMQNGEISPARFKGLRVPWGIYSHRGGKVYMNRIRIPAGIISSLQLKALSFVSDKYGDGILHITTREDIQIHNVRIEDTIKVIEYLKDYQLSSRGGGGNTVRNIVCCPLAGICRDEIFDVRGYVIALSEQLLRQETSFTLPRKFKIAFSGCQKDCSACRVNDLGFMAQYNNKRGFKVFVGGGMGAQSQIGSLLEEFISEEDLGYCVFAVKNIFYRKGNRRDKHHNRLRFLINDIGFDEFKKLYKQEFKDLKEKEYIALRKINFSERIGVNTQIPQEEDEKYREFLKYNIFPQRQEGFVSIESRIPRGDISAGQLSSLADLEKYFPGIEFRTSQNQNLFICWVENKDVYKIFLKLKDILDEFLYPQTLLDVVVCKGALTCNLGLCNSPGLAKELEDTIKKNFIGKKIFKNLDIKLNGCPNACGQQPLGKLSFYGMVKRVDSRAAPFYKFLIGGRKEAGYTKLAEEIGIIPAKNIPGFLKEFLTQTESKINEQEDIYKFLDNGAKELANEIIEKYIYLPSYNENKDFYIDWGKTEEFSLSGLGAGECGAGVLDMIESDLDEARIALEEADKNGYSLKEIKKVLFLSVRSLLVVKGSDPKNEEEAFSDFQEKFIKEAIASDSYSNIKDVFVSLSEELSVEERKKKFLYAKEFLNHINNVYKNMDSSFNFPKQEVAVQDEAKIINTLDLRGTPCPINYVKIKLFLENLESGDMLEVFLDEGEPINNVPKSLEEDGHKVVKIEKQDRFYKVVLRKK